MSDHDTDGRVGAEPARPVPALRLVGLSKTFGAAKALDGVDLDLTRGEIHGLVGRNGSGKSTLIKVLSGYHVPDPGARLEIGGVPVPLPVPSVEAYGTGSPSCTRTSACCPT